MYQRTIAVAARQSTAFAMPSLLQRSLRNPWIWRLALACYWLALFIGTHIPIERLQLHRGNADKFAHVAAYGVLALLVATTWRIARGPLQLRQLFYVWAIVVLYGAIEETTQPAANRSASVIDWLADAIGAALGLTIFWFGADRWLRKLTPPQIAAAPGEQPRTWRRYSLRTLFVAMALTALVCYWLMLPTMNAQRFVRTLQEKDYATAESLFSSAENAFPGSFKSYEFFAANANIAPWTWADFWKGERRISVAIDYGDGGGMIGCGADIRAHRQGLELGLLAP